MPATSLDDSRTREIQAECGVLGAHLALVTLGPQSLLPTASLRYQPRKVFDRFEIRALVANAYHKMIFR
jgi:hypothetical protein